MYKDRSSKAVPTDIEGQHGHLIKSAERFNRHSSL